MSTGSDKTGREFEASFSEEEARVAALYRKLPQPEPDPRLDAAVRSMAHRALNPQLVATPRAGHARRPPRRWLTGLGAAAGVVLAAGIAFKLGPGLRDTRDERGAPVSDVISVRAIDAPPAAPPLSPPVPPPVDARSGAATTSALASPPPPRPVPAPQAFARKDVEEAASETAGAGLQSAPSAAAAAAPAPPAAAANAFPGEAKGRKRASSSADAVERRETMAVGAWQNLHDQDSPGQTRSTNEPPQRADAGSARSPPARDVRELDKAAAPGAAGRSNAPAAGLAVPAAAPQSAGGALQAPPPEREPSQPPRSAAKQNAPPRSADPNARLYPEHWLANIRTLLREQRRDEALRSLAEFRRLYPDYRLPDDLRDLP